MANNMYINAAPIMAKNNISMAVLGLLLYRTIARIIPNSMIENTIKVSF